jgi:hypothetical protein
MGGLDGLMNRFTNDIFISYRHLDNAPVSGSSGWIDDFTAKLKTQLGFKLGYDPIIWRDRKLGGGEYFADVIMKELERSKVLISILSPGYISPKSEWCLKELSEFCRLAEQGSGVRVGERSRCLRVIKSFLERHQYPVQLQDQLGYEFYEMDEESGRPSEFSYLPEGDQYGRYLKKIDELAFDISELLKSFDQPQAAPSAADHEHTVYLAETTTDRTEYRDNIRNELLSRSFRVLPDKELPDTAAEYRAAVSDHLKQARLSIHLIGEKYGRMLEGDEENSIVQIQNELAAQLSGEADGLSRVIWIAPDLVPQGKLQPAFIDLLRSNKEAQNGAELLERPFEELKNRIIEKLAPPKQTAARLLQFPQEGLVRIYLMCDKLDFASVTEIRDYLYEKNYEVVLAAREGEAVQVIEYHKENLLECDATLIYYGHGNEFWLHSKLSDLRKVRAWGREKPLLKGIYLAAPETDPKRDYKTREAVLLKPPGYGGLSEAALEEFIAYIENSKADQPQTGSGGAR